MTHFNFQTRKAVNPLELVTNFFVNPYMPQNYTSLKLEERSGDKGTFTMEVRYINGIPCPMYPIDLLELGTCLVKWTSDCQGQLTFTNEKGNTCTLYFKIFEEQYIRIDTILWR